MGEGWRGEEYLILFDAEESRRATERYHVSRLLPGFRVIGLRGWDDFIVCDSDGAMCTVPTVPAISKYLKPFKLPESANPLVDDPLLRGRIKWYVQPLIFGGSPTASDNIIWVDHETHATLVVWWNKRYLGASNCR
jgi:hypothetical protein